MVDKIMCSSICPCSLEAQTLFETILDSDLRNLHYRTIAIDQNNAAEVSAAIDPVLQWSLTTIIPLVFQSTNYYNTYWECANFVLYNIPTQNIQNQNWINNYNQFIGNKGYNYFAQIEINHAAQCAGFCTGTPQYPLFQISQSVTTLGPVTPKRNLNDCV